MFRPLPLVIAVALAAAIPPKTFAQTASAPAADNEALRNIQNNFAHMTPPPRKVESSNKDLQQNKAAPANRAGDGRGRGRMRQQQQPPDAGTANTDGKPPAPADTPPASDSPPPATTP